jgi:hypothetical protein
MHTFIYKHIWKHYVQTLSCDNLLDIVLHVCTTKKTKTCGGGVTGLKEGWLQKFELRFLKFELC